ncbi:MAG: methionine--tRNA ligase [bacterium]|nr:methionine--tRNA ligase [bacterium]
MVKKTYLTTTLPYVNADPHIGFALELVQADIMARTKRLRGEEVFFNTGTDEHGLKIYRAAEAAGLLPQDYVDGYAQRYVELQTVLNISTDAFIRTTAPVHIAATQELWRRCEKDIEKKKFKGLYCVGCEAFVKEKDLIAGNCPDHRTPPEEVEEENYFFKFSRYQNKLLAYLKSDQVIIPEFKRLEAETFVKNGLEDFSISRLKSKMPWGIPVPGDSDQVMYVWFDALTNYISTLGWPSENGDFKKFWQEGETIQLAGKDQVRFQSLMWQSMLLSAGIKNTDTVVYHGFINVDGQKMSKSIGNVVDPIELVKEYSTDAVRYYLARHINSFEDSDFTMEKFKEAYNAGLANGLGNLVSRVMKMAQDNLAGVPEIPDNTVPQEFFDLLDKFEFNKTADLIWQKITKLDHKIQTTEPFKLIKTDREQGLKIINELVVDLYTVGRMLNPIMPATSVLIKQLIKDNKTPEQPLFPRKD